MKPFGGQFNITGDYACAVNKAVYLAIVSQGTGFGGEFNVYEFIGLDAPTITPIIYAVKNGLQGTRPYEQTAVTLPVTCKPHYLKIGTKAIMPRNPGRGSYRIYGSRST